MLVKNELTAEFAAGTWKARTAQMALSILKDNIQYPGFHMTAVTFQIKALVETMGLVLLGYRASFSPIPLA